jgi:hypothetical protein
LPSGRHVDGEHLLGLARDDAARRARRLHQEKARALRPERDAADVDAGRRDPGAERAPERVVGDRRREADAEPALRQGDRRVHRRAAGPQRGRRRRRAGTRDGEIPERLTHTDHVEARRAPRPARVERLSAGGQRHGSL